MLSGNDHEVHPGKDGTLIRSRHPDRHVDIQGLSVTQEAALLDLVRPISPLPVPEILQVWPEAEAMEMQRLPGVDLLERRPHLGPGEPEAIAAELGRFMAALATVPERDLQGIVDIDATPLHEYLAEAVDLVDRHGEAIPRARRDGVSRFLERSVPPAAPSLCLTHHDLGAEHVLLDEVDGHITGIIDWSDAARSDPALDLGLIRRDLGQPAFDRAVAAFAAHGGDTREIRPRALFLARVRALEDLAFGIEQERDTHRHNALRAIDDLFR